MTSDLNRHQVVLMITHIYTCKQDTHKSKINKSKNIKKNTKNYWTNGVFMM